MPYIVAINDTDLATINVHPEEVTDWHGAPRRTYPTLRIPGRQGAVLAGDPEVTERILRIRCLIQPYAHTILDRLTAEDRLKALAYQGLVQVIRDDGVTSPRSIDGVCERCDIAPRGHPVVGVASVADLEVRCPDPTWRSVVGSIVSFSKNANSQVALGTAPSGGVVRIYAPSWSANVVDPVLSYYTSGLVLVQSMTFTTTLTAGTQYLEVDLDRATIVKYTSGVAADGITLLSAGDFFALDPTDGDNLTNAWPYLGIAASSGDPSAAWYGSKRYL